jgi:hypothetical protein
MVEVYLGTEDYSNQMVEFVKPGHRVGRQLKRRAKRQSESQAMAKNNRAPEIES